ncbi:MAG: hypothetical protein ACXVAN_16365 [Polyangia bacterium]
MRLRLVVVAVALAGCAPKPPAGPAETLRAFADAVRAGRTADAYALMSADYRKTHDKDAFVRGLSPADQRSAGQLAKGRVALRAEVELADGERLELVQEPDGWRFARDPLDVYPQRAPDEALRSFVRAVERKRWDVVLRFIPQRYRSTITADSLKERWDGAGAGELKAQLLVVKAHLDEPMELAADEARLPVGERKQVKLVREEGVWRVETLE